MLAKHLKAGMNVIVTPWGVRQHEALKIASIYPSEPNGLSGYYKIIFTSEDDLAIEVPGDRVFMLINGIPVLC